MKHQPFNLIILLLLIGGFTHAQQVPTLGLIIDEETDIAYQKLEKIPLFEGARYDELPFMVDFKKYAPKVVNQGLIGNCVGWSVGYAAQSIMVAKKNKWTDKELITQEAFSSAYIYNQIKRKNCAGARLDTACHILVEQGNLKARDFDDLNGCDRMPNTEERAMAQQHKIKEYYGIFDQDESKKNKIFKTKRALADGNPVIIGMRLRENFWKPTPEGFWDSETGKVKTWGDHAMCIVGYHENKQAFEIMNSWGEDWGNQGHIWVKYDDFAKYCKYAYLLIMEEEGEIALSNTKISQIHSLKGEFKYQMPVFNNESDKITFREIEVYKKSGYIYDLDRECEEGDMFQLVSRKISPNKYVYALSINSEGEVRIHWPRNAQFNHKHEGYNDSPIVPSKDAEIIIPNKNNALVKNTKGTDYLIVLYSSERIDDFGNIVQKMVDKQNAVEKNLKSLLGSRLMALEDINFEQDRMKFNAEFSEGSIVPLILRADEK